jgi:hypothetical protein
VSYHKAIGWMVLCLLLAAVLRLPNVEEQPPGLHYDEAANVVIIREIVYEGARPAFIPSYTGKEPLFFYLAAITGRLLGVSVFSMRLTMAFVGLLTIAAAYWAGCELTGRRRVALLAAALMAVTFWHVLFSRYGFRANSQPLLQALTIACLFRGLRLSRWSWLVAAGVFLGLTGYTYLASRLFPVLLLLSLWPLLLTPPPRERGTPADKLPPPSEGEGRVGVEKIEGMSSRHHLLQLTVVIFIAFLVLIPLLRYFWLHPAAFWVRIGQVAPGAAGSLTLSESYLKSLAMLFVQGDPYWRFNLPGRPIFPWFWGILLVCGWLAALVQLWRTRSPRQRAAYLLLALAPFIMLLPTALAVNEIVPSNLRAVGLNPFIFYLPALGVMAVLRIAYSLLKKDTPYAIRHMHHASRFTFHVSRFTQYATRHTPSLYPLILLLTLTIGFYSTYRLYFDEWATRTDLFYEADGDLVAAATYLDEVETNGRPIYMAALHYRHPTVAALSRNYGAVKWLPGSSALVLPADGPGLYVYPHNSPLPDWAAPYLRGATVASGPDGPDNRPLYTTYELAVRPEIPFANPASANFENVATLLGYQAGSAAAGDELPVTLFWRIDRTPPSGLLPFVHLEDQWGYRWGQAEGYGYPAEQWQAGELLIEQVVVPVRPGAPPGLYRLRAGLFDPASGQALDHLDTAGRYAGSALVIENVAISAGTPPTTLPFPPHLLDQPAEVAGLHLLGYERAGQEVAQGDALWLALWWQATAPLPSLTTRLELLRPDNTSLILTNTQPVYGTYPFHTWQTPQLVIDQLAPRIEASVAAGDYQLQLRLMDSADETVLTAGLGPVTVVETERLFTPPQPAIPLEATFGDEIQLLGYDLVEEPDGRTLALIWQAAVQPSADYTVFVHVLGLDGTCCIWQQDVMPRQNSYATSRWLPGEVVVDDYRLDLPPDLPAGLYGVEIGLYRAENGQRLRVRVPGAADNDALYLRPLLIE